MPALPVRQITALPVALHSRHCETTRGRPGERGRPRWWPRVPHGRRPPRRGGCRCSVGSGRSGWACWRADEPRKSTAGRRARSGPAAPARRRAGRDIRAAAGSAPAPARSSSRSQSALVLDTGRPNSVGQITMVAPGSTGNTGHQRLIWAMMLEPQVSRWGGRSRTRRPRWVSPLGCRRRMRRSAQVAAGSRPRDSITARNAACTSVLRMKERLRATALARNSARSNHSCASGGACGANASQASARARATRAAIAGNRRNTRISPR